MTFNEYIELCRAKKFAWGEHDCVLFAIGWLNIVSGTNWLEGYKWDSKDSAYKIIESIGGVSKNLDKHLKPIQPNAAKDGDITILDKSLMLFAGSKIVGVGLRGLEFKDRGLAKCAWSY